MKMSLELHRIDDDENDVRALTVTKEIGQWETYAETIISLTEQMKHRLFTGKMDLIIGKKEEFIPIEWIRKWFSFQQWMGSSMTDRITCNANDIIEEWRRENNKQRWEAENDKG